MEPVGQPKDVLGEDNLICHNNKAEEKGGFSLERKSQTAVLRHDERQQCNDGRLGRSKKEDKVPSRIPVMIHSSHLLKRRMQMQVSKNADQAKPKYSLPVVMAM